MYCSKCGQKLNDGDLFCSNCGAAVEEGMEDTLSGKSEGTLPEAAKEPEEILSKGAEKKKGFRFGKGLIAVVAIVIALVAVFAIAGSSGDSDTVDISEIIESVQNGYLGNYDTVSIKSVLDYAYGAEEWTGGISDSGEYYIVEFVNDFVDIQFSVYEGEETFSVSGFAIPDADETYTAYEVKTFIDALYSSYAGMYPDSGLYIDESTDNDTLVGHYGPVKSVEESAQQDAVKETEELSEADQMREYLKKYGVEEVYAIDDFTDEEVTELYNEIYSYIEEQWNGEIDIEACREGLWDSEYAIFTEEEADSLTDYEVIRYAAHQEEYYWAGAGYSDEGQDVNIYGTYECDNGETAVMTAEIGFATDGEETDYIYIDALSYGDRYLAQFAGYLIDAGTNTYVAEDTDYGCELMIVFDKNGMSVTVESAEYEDFEVLGGYYNKTSEIDPSQVG